MKQLKHISFSVLSLSLALPLLVITPALAKDGADDNPSNQSTTTTVTSTSDSQQSGKSTATTRASRSGENEPVETTETEVETHRSHSDATEARSRALKIIAEMKQEHGAMHTDAERQKACEVRKDRLENRFDKMHNGSAVIKTKLDSILDKAVTYQIANNVTTNNVPALVLAAQTAKTTSQDSVTALTALKPQIDCTKPDATKVAAFKAGAEAARTNLKAYRSAIHALLDALKSASTGTTDTNASTTTTKVGE